MCPSGNGHRGRGSPGRSDVWRIGFPEYVSHTEHVEVRQAHCDTYRRTHYDNYAIPCAEIGDIIKIGIALITRIHCFLPEYNER